MAVLLALVTFFSTGLGGFVAIRFRDRLHLLLAFSSGAVLGVVFFDLLPEIFRSTSSPKTVLVGSAAGFMVFFALERYTAMHAAREHEHHGAEEHDQELGVIGAAGLSVHSFLDGVAIGIGFQANPTLGILIAMAVIAHDFSDGLNTVTVLLAHGNSLKRSVRWLLVDMTTPLLGAASTLLFQLPPSVLPWLLAFFAGFFLYIGASDLLPEAREHKSPLVLIATGVGMLAVFAATRFL